jgi:DNA mismatch repair protein MutL
MQQRLADFFKAAAPVPAQTVMEFPPARPAVAPPASPVPVTLPQSLDDPRMVAPVLPPTPIVTEHPSAPAVAPAPPSATPVESAPASDTGSSSPVPSSVEPARAIQLHNSYLVAETDDGLVIIDQHALHERVIFEELLARVSRGPLESQRLLIPVTFRAGSRQVELLDQIRGLLARLGIEAEPFGPDAVAVQAFPSFLHRLDPGEFVRELLERGEHDLLGLTPEQLLHELLDMMACKAAVKAGDPLSPTEIAALLARRELVDRSSNCPHGRPTTLRMSLRDLEKQFKRTGF